MAHEFNTPDLHLAYASCWPSLNTISLRWNSNGLGPPANPMIIGFPT